MILTTNPVILTTLLFRVSVAVLVALKVIVFFSLFHLSTLFCVRYEPVCQEWHRQ